MAQDEMGFDYETWSRLNLKKYGLARYARHRSTEILMAGYDFNGGRVNQWVPAEGEKIPSDFKEALLDPQVIKRAWNAPFEWNITNHVLGIPLEIDQMRCTQVEAMALSLPGKLSKCGEVLDLPEDIQKMANQGESLVRYFTMPRKPTKTRTWTRETHLTNPKKWELFKEYNRRDVTAEGAIKNKIRRWPLMKEEWELWFLDHDINEAGIPVNLHLIDNALDIIDYMVAWRMKEMQRITGLDNPNSGDQLLPWLQDQGYPFVDLKKGHIEQALDDWREDDGKGYKKVLQLRQDVSRAAIKKYQAYENFTGPDDGLYRNAVQFMGAGRTGRWSGRGVQVHNLFRPADWLEKKPMQEQAVEILEHCDPVMFEILYHKPFDVLATCVRPAIQAPEGLVFVDADLNAIENRGLGYVADDQKILDVFREGRDPYIDFAKYMYEETYEALWAEYKAGDKRKRQNSKPPVLGCGYGLGAGHQFENHQTGEIEATGLLGYAWNMGVKMLPEESKFAVKIWRKTYTDVIEFWKAIAKAAIKCVRTGQRTYVNDLEFDLSGPFLRMRLPSGRYLYYLHPKLESRKTPWGEWKETLTYENQNEKGQWVRVTTHPGKLTENAVQAIARDILAHGMQIAYRRGVDVRIHVHDQVVGLAKEDQAEKKLAILIDSMRQMPRWCDNRFPLDATGTISKIFIKD